MKFNRFFLAVILMALVVPGSLIAGYPQTITTTTPFVNLPRPDGPEWTAAFKHWDKRDDTDEVIAAHKAFTEIYKKYPESLTAKIWMARSTYLAAMRGKRSEIPENMKEAVKYADEALEMDPENGFAVYWRYCAMLHFHDFTESEFEHIRALGEKYSHLREFPVPDDDPLWETAMKHWDGRMDRSESLKAIALFETLHQKYPGRIEPRFWLCRSNYWMHYISPTSEEKAKWLSIAMDWGKKAVEIEPRNPGANYFTASATGQYASHTSFLNMARYSIDIAKRLTLVMEEDPNYFYGGVSQYFALAIARAGSVVETTLDIVGFSPELIEKSTVFAAAYEPRYIRNFYALGEMYLARGEKEEAKKWLIKTVEADPSALKLQEPENRVAKDLARKLLNENFPETR